MTGFIATVDSIVFDIETHKYLVAAVPNLFVINCAALPPKVCPMVVSPFFDAASAAILAPFGPNPVQNDVLVNPETE